MNKKSLITSLNSWSTLSQNDITACISFISYDKKSHAIKFHKLSLDQNLVSTFTEIAKETLLNTLKRLSADSLSKFKPTVPVPSGELPYTVSKESPLIASVNELDDLNSLDLYDHKTFPQTKLHGYVITLENDVLGKIHFLAKYNKQKELTKKKILSRVTLNNQFNKVVEPTFLFDKHIHCLVLGENAYILDKRNFLTLFKFHDDIKNVGIESAKKIIKMIPMINSAEFIADCSNDMRALVKLNNIRQGAGFNTLSVQSIVAIKKQGFPVSLDIDDSNGNEQIVYTKEKMWEILRVMDDDYATTAIGGSKIEAIAKRSV